MKIDATLLTKLEKLSNVTIDDAKRDEVIEQLSSILTFVDNLSELDDKLSAYTNVTPHNKLHMRDDVPVNSHTAASMLPIAPSSRDGFFLVPKIIE
jgi:aspartyl-tRNA(Asn)/glutamyl-tRNA(Gln) amidotransferase subunit C